MDELKLKNLQAMADSERLQKEGFLKEITQSIELLNNLEDRICIDAGIPTKQHKPNESIVSIARSLSINTIAIMADMKMKTTKNGYDALKAEFDKLVLERDAIQKTETILKEEPSPTPIDEIKKDLVESPPQPKEEKSDVDEINEILEIHNKTSQGSVIETDVSKSAAIGDHVLKLASECHLFRLNDLIDLCSIKLDVADTEITKAIDDLSSAGLLSVERSNIKPTGSGITYPALFRLTTKGLAKANTETVSEIDRWALLAPGLLYNDMPLMVYAVDNYLPRHNYSFEGFFKKISIDIPGNSPCEIYPHIHLKDEAQKDVYVMFGYETMSDKVLNTNLTSYQHLSNERQYCLCVNGRIARIFTSKLDFQNKHYFSSKIAFNITNVGDWTKYDHMLKSGLPDTPKTIWFTSIVGGK